MIWGGGDDQKYMIADRLTRCRFLSEAVIFMDSVVVLSLFSQLSEKGPGREHLLRVLALSMEVDVDIRRSIQDAFNAALPGYSLRNAVTFQSCANALTKKLWRDHRMLKIGSQSVLEWFVSYCLHLNIIDQLVCMFLGALLPIPWLYWKILWYG